MTPFEHASARWPGIEEKVLDRLVSVGNLFNGKNHSLLNGISREEARAILLLASKISRDCGLTLVLSSDEKKLMHPKFVTKA
jgi:hypothetical protein